MNINKIKLIKKSKDNKNSTPRKEILIGSKHNFMFTEACKALRTNVIFSLPKEGCRKIMITSSVAGEGKTTIIVHLAAAFAQTGASVLIVDCDMRCGRVHRLFELKRNPGLSNVLGGFSEISAAVQKTKVDNLYILPAGVVPPNSSELLSSKKMSEMIKEFEKSFDYIFFDTPPIVVVSDALPLSEAVDGVIVVARNDFTDKGMLQRCVSSLEFARAKILGVVFNDADRNQKSRQYRYYNAYRYKKYSSYRYNKRYAGYYNIEEPQQTSND